MATVALNVNVPTEMAEAVQDLIRQTEDPVHGALVLRALNLGHAFTEAGIMVEPLVHSVEDVVPS